MCLAETQSGRVHRGLPAALKFGLLPLGLEALFRCGRCRKSYSNPLGHVCTVRSPKGRVRVKPRASASLAVCGTCGKPYSNPLGHVCIVKTDFRRRTAAGKRRAAAAAKRKKPLVVRAKKKAPAGRASAQAHDYRACRDEDCARTACVAWREALAEGYRDGWKDGHAEGYRAGTIDGYAAGYADGLAAGSR